MKGHRCPPVARPITSGAPLFFMLSYIVKIFVTQVIAVFIALGQKIWSSFKRKKVIEQAKSDYVSAKTDADKEKAFEELVKVSDPNSD